MNGFRPQRTGTEWKYLHGEVLTEQSTAKSPCQNKVSVQGREIGFNAGKQRSSSGTKMIGAQGIPRVRLHFKVREEYKIFSLSSNNSRGNVSSRTSRNNRIVAFDQSVGDHE